MFEVSLIFPRKMFGTDSNHFAREVIAKGHLFSFGRAEGREPRVPPGYPQNLGFSRVSGPDLGLGHPAIPFPQSTFVGGFGDPQNYGIYTYTYIYIYIHT